MNTIKRFIVVCLTLIVSCKNESPKPVMQNMVNEMTELECRAVKLREQRFALANEIRFGEDTLLHFSSKRDTLMLHNKLQALNAQKQAMQMQSVSLGDSIKHRLDSFMQNHLTDTAMKHQFSNALNGELMKRGCIKKE